MTSFLLTIGFFLCYKGGNVLVYFTLSPNICASHPNLLGKDFFFSFYEASVF